MCLNTELSSHEPPVWNDEFARKLVELTVLVEITHVGKEGSRTEQFYGKVQSVDPTRGIALRLLGSRDGSIYWLPPDLTNFIEASPGEYRLRTTGETVENPDYTVTWTIYPKST